MSTVMSTARTTPTIPGSRPTSSTPRLRRGVSLIVRVNDQPMLFDSDSGKYHRLGATAVSIMGQFDGVRSLPTIIEKLSQDTDEAGAKCITGLVDNLHDKGLLAEGEPASTDSVAPDASAAPAHSRHSRGHHTAQPRRIRRLKVKRLRRNGGWWLPRTIIARKYRRIITPIVTLLQRLPAPALSWVFLTLATYGYAAGVMTLNSLAGGPRPEVLVSVTAMTIQLVGILLHESRHAIVADYLGIPIRGLGVAFMFRAIPIVYVDHTGSYRVRSRSRLTMLTLASIFSDDVVCGLEAVVIWVSTGTVRQVAPILYVFQLTMFVTNLNLLTQSDGVATVEAATSSVNLRGRSMFVLRCILTRQPLPPGLTVMRPAVHWNYFICGLACSLLGLVAFVMSAVWIGYWLYALLEGFLL